MRGALALAAIAVVLVGLFAVAAPAARAKTRTCDLLKTMTATNTWCATARKVDREYTRRCDYSSPYDRMCSMTVLGFRCRATGTAWDPVFCRKGRARVRFQLAE